MKRQHLCRVILCGLVVSLASCSLERSQQCTPCQSRMNVRPSLAVQPPNKTYPSDTNTINPNTTLLPNPFSVYTNGSVVINHPYPGFEQKSLPVNNDYRQQPGCYLGCHTHQKAVYAVSKTINVVGMVRVAGVYQGRICHPTGYQNQDITKSARLNRLCDAAFTSCKGQCWVGGDTGGWYGIQ